MWYTQIKLLMSIYSSVSKADKRMEREKARKRNHILATLTMMKIP